MATAISDYFNKRRDSATIRQERLIANDLRERAGGGLEVHRLKREVNIVGRELIPTVKP